MEALYCQCDPAEDVFRRDGRAWTGFDLKTYLRRTERAGIGALHSHSVDQIF